uniref:Uncharacterized protein n=1 Tax=Haptolina brevifila TaxID=156173 RepID=A0A7S2NLT4_9EUKA
MGAPNLEHVVHVGCGLYDDQHVSLHIGVKRRLQEAPASGGVKRRQEVKTLASGGFRRLQEAVALGDGTQELTRDEPLLVNGPGLTGKASVSVSPSVAQSVAMPPPVSHAHSAPSPCPSPRVSRSLIARSLIIMNPPSNTTSPHGAHNAQAHPSTMTHRGPIDSDQSSQSAAGAPMLLPLGHRFRASDTAAAAAAGKARAETKRRLAKLEKRCQRIASRELSSVAARQSQQMQAQLQALQRAGLQHHFHDARLLGCLHDSMIMCNLQSTTHAGSGPKAPAERFEHQDQEHQDEPTNQAVVHYVVPALDVRSNDGHHDDDSADDDDDDGAPSLTSIDMAHGNSCDHAMAIENGRIMMASAVSQLSSLRQEDLSKKMS